MPETTTLPVNPDSSSSDADYSSTTINADVSTNSTPLPVPQNETCLKAFGVCYPKWTDPIEASSIPDFCEYALYGGNQCMLNKVC